MTEWPPPAGLSTPLQASSGEREHYLSGHRAGSAHTILVQINLEMTAPALLAISPVCEDALGYSSLFQFNSIEVIAKV